MLRLMMVCFPCFCFGNAIYNDYLSDVQAHRIKCLSNIVQLHKNDPGYSWFDRTLVTLSCGDCDYIPKIVDAGKVFQTPEGEYQLMHNGVKVVKDCYYGYSTWQSDIIFGLKGHHEPKEEKVFHEILKYVSPKSVMIELGSYWAYYSLWFSSKVPKAKNYMIEPDLQRMGVGEKNFKLNGKNGVFVHGYAATRDNRDDADFAGAKPIFIDEFMKAEKVDRVAILHADIQGAEYEMLMSCKEALKKKKIDFFVISTHSDALHASCLKLLAENGYAVIAEHTPGQSYSYDGLIAASGPHVKGPGPIEISKKH